MSAAARYAATSAPRQRRENALAHFAIVERPGADPYQDEQPHTCRHCGAATAILHPDPESNDCRRTICGHCQGEANARRAGISPREEENQR